MARIVQVGIVGSGFMGRVHSAAYATLGPTYGDAVVPIARRRLAARTAARATRAAARFGWATSTDDWRAVTRAPDIDAVDVVTPTYLHEEVVLDALRHGKHVLCEKPLAPSVDAARRMADAAADAGVVAQVGFVFRHWPAVTLARQLIDAGRIGRVLAFRAHYFHDYALDPALAVSWRLRRDTAGAGSIGDIGCHLLDLARLLVGEIAAVTARSATVYPRRPLVGEPAEPVDVDDTTDVLVDFAGGATGVISTSWVASGYGTDLAFEVGGEEGALRFTWRRNAQLEFHSRADGQQRAGFREIVLGPQHNGAAEFWPVAGKGLGYGDGFLIQARSWLDRISHEDTETQPSFADGLRVAEAVEAIQRSADQRARVELAPTPEVMLR